MGVRAQSPAVHGGPTKEPSVEPKPQIRDLQSSEALEELDKYWRSQSEYTQW